MQSTEKLLIRAINDKRLVTFILHTHPRVAEPHDYGMIKGDAKLFFYQVGGKSSGPLPGWRWARPPEIFDLQILDQRFAGPRPAPTSRRIQWDYLIATVSPRPVSPPSTAKPSSRKKKRRSKV
jgi:hypothetical protein